MQTIQIILALIINVNEKVPSALFSTVLPLTKGFLLNHLSHGYPHSKTVFHEENSTNMKKTYHDFPRFSNGNRTHDLQNIAWNTLATELRENRVLRRTFLIWTVWLVNYQLLISNTKVAEKLKWKVRISFFSNFIRHAHFYTQTVLLRCHATRQVRWAFYFPSDMCGRKSFPKSNQVRMNITRKS